jgi:hypothetical protein
MLYSLSRIVREARVDRGGLHDGATGRNEPSETLARQQQANCAGFGPTFAYEPRYVQVRPDDLGVEVGVERPQSFRVEMDAGIEEPRVLAVEHDPGVY